MTSIADILLQSGRDVAAGERAQGEIRANEFANLGQIISAVPRDIAAQRTQQQEQQIRDQQLASAKRQNDNAALVDHTKKAMGALMNDPSVLNEDGTFNLKGITDKLSQMPAGASGPVQPIDLKTIADTIDPINQSILTAKENGLKYQQTKANAMAGLAAGALRLGKIDGNYFGHAATALTAAQKSGLMTDQEATQTLTHLVEHKEEIPQVLEDFVARSNVPNVKLAEGDTLVSGLDPTTVLAKGAEKPPTEAELAVKAAQGDPTAAGAMDRLKPQPPANAAADDQKYEAIKVKLSLNPALVTKEERAFVDAYNDRRTVTTDAAATAAANRQAAAQTQANDLQKRAQDFQVSKEARAELAGKVESPYLTARTSADTLRDVVDAAAKGNKVAAALQSLEATMGAIRSQGLNRINGVEIGTTANAGSLFDRIDGWIGKATEGQPVPADIQKDMKEFADILDKAAYKKYSDQFDSIAKFYSLNDEQKSLKMPPPDSVKPLKGERRLINGKLGEWDGTGWAPVVGR